MARIVCALTVAALLSAGYVVLAWGDPTSPLKSDAVTFTAVKTAKGDAIQVTVEDIAFEVPQRQLESKRNLVVADNGQLGTVVPIDPDDPH